MQTTGRAPRRAAFQGGHVARAGHGERSKTVLRHVLALLFGVGLLVGCGSTPLSIQPGARAFTPEDYNDVYQQWTRSADEFSFERLQTVLHLTATFESWEFRWAYVVRYAEDYGLATEERTRLLRSTLDDAQERHRFLITLAGARFRESDLTDPRSAWRVLLIPENGRPSRPVEVTRIRRPSAAERIYFPTVGRQRRTFRIAFPTRHPDGAPTIPSDSEHFLFRVTGAEGRVDLRWDLARGSLGDAGENAR